MKFGISPLSLLPLLLLLLFVQSAFAGAGTQGLPDFSVLVEESADAVVNVSTTRQPQQRRNNGRGFPSIPKDSPWFEFFEDFFNKHGAPPEMPLDPRSLGSGFVISRDGFIITNYHVVKDADEIIIRLNDRRELAAEVIGTDVQTDIALLKVEAKDLPTVDFGSSKDLKPGQWVVAIGSPFGFEYSVTAGIVSALHRSLPSENYVPFIQTDVAVNPGNSGGPLFNLDGKVIGINSQIYSHTGGFMGVSFAIPIDVAMYVVNQLKEGGEVIRGWLGVYIQEVTRELSESFGMDKPQGALISGVIEGSPAEGSKIEIGDIILEFDGREVESAGSLPPMVGQTAVDKHVKLKVLRGGERNEIEVKIGRLPEKMRPGSKRKLEYVVLGLTLADIKSDEREAIGLKSGAVKVVAVATGPAEKAGMRSGDLLLAVDNHHFDSLDEFRKVVPKLQRDQFITVLVMRNKRTQFLAMIIPSEE